jgi:imidazolonepropionase-like amidohydrolase
LLGLKEIGEIKAGKKADILVLERNPVKNVKNLKTIFMVIHNGKVISRDELLK